MLRLVLCRYVENGRNFKCGVRWKKKDACLDRRRRRSGCRPLACSRPASDHLPRGAGKHEEKQRGDPRAPPQARFRRPAGPSPAVDLMWVRPSAAPSISWLECKPTRFPSQESFLFMTNPTKDHDHLPRPQSTPTTSVITTETTKYPGRVAGRSNRPTTNPCFPTSHAARSCEMT
jgi:hypothetical protein